MNRSGERLQLAREVAGCQEVGEMGSELIVAIVMEPFDRRVLDGAVDPFDLAVGPWVVGLGQAVLDPVCFADHVETHWPGRDGVAFPRFLGELDSVACWV